MSSSRLAKARARNAEAIEKTFTEDAQPASFGSEEELRAAYYEATHSEVASGKDAIKRSEGIRILLQEAGYSILDVREVTFNELNDYKITEADVEGLADLIEISHNTQPVIVRCIAGAAGEGTRLQVIDGERRCRAHRLLAERTGDETWYCIPARVYALGQLDDETAEFMLNAENIGQRAMSVMDRARGTYIVARHMARAAAARGDADAKGASLKAVAEKFGVSERTAHTLYSIGESLTERAGALLDAGTITQGAAEAIAKLGVEDQEALCEAIESGAVAGADAKEAAQEARAEKRGKRTYRRKPWTAEDSFSKAAKQLRKCVEENRRPPAEFIESLRSLLDQVEAIGEDADLEDEAAGKDFRG